MAKSKVEIDESITDRSRRTYDAEKERLRTTPDTDALRDLEKFGSTNDLLSQILVQLKIGNKHLEEISDEVFKENDTED